MIPKIRVFAKAGTKELFGGGYDRDQMFYEIRDIDFYDEDVTVWGCHRKNCGMCDDTYKMEDVKIMMSTGMKDKDGVEIYEGDILYHPLQGARRVFYPYSESVASYGLREVKTGFGSTLQDAHAVWQVIGNIYENPELLEGLNE